MNFGPFKFHAVFPEFLIYIHQSYLYIGHIIIEDVIFLINFNAL